MSDNILKLYADVATADVSQELATALGIPDPAKRQPDLQYITAVFVSSGYNLNSAYFLPSELINARDTIAEKPLDLEHEQEKIVGHLYSSAFANKDGSLFDPVELSSQLGADVEKVSMDIITAMRLYKARFPELATEIVEGKYKVSMECYYRDFDIIVDNLIIPKAEATSIGLVDVINNVVTVVEGSKKVGKHRVGRVLRGMLFSGCGLVENPANPDSLILETAAVNNDNYILDLTKVDSYMKAKQEDETIVVHSLEGCEKDKAYLSASYGGSHRHDVPLDQGETFLDGSHTHLVLPDSLPDGHAVYFVRDGFHRHGFSSSNGKIESEKGHTHKVYIEKKGGGYVAVESGPAMTGHSHELAAVDVEESYDYNTDKVSLKKGENMGETSFGGVHHHNVVLEDGTKLKTVTPSDILKMDSSVKQEEKLEAAGTGNVDGKPLSTPDKCVSFKRYVYAKGGDNHSPPPNADKTPGLVPQVDSVPAPGVGGAGETITQNDEIVHENWCSLFEVACTTPGGMAVHPECLRLVLDRTTKETVTNYYEKLEENRKKVGVNKALSSLLEIMEEANKVS